MKKLILIAACSLALAACDSAPSEESPVQPAIVCDDTGPAGTCAEYEEVITEEDLVDGDVPTNEEQINPVLNSNEKPK